jgi:hypothetical protein
MGGAVEGPVGYGSRDHSDLHVSSDKDLRKRGDTLCRSNW